ncbi:MAG: 16S rRNA (guanine(527)-N(7))-methyltransferase RsmG [Candidatus Korobacteraceae bacterium]
MEAAALCTLLAPFVPPAELDDLLLNSIAVHLSLLVRWNQRMNLTALRTPEAMVERHFGESLFAARHLCPRNSQHELFDLGSGAGFPGLPIKYWAPSLQLTLIESHGKKATFLREVGRALNLTGFSVLNVRAESLPQRAPLVTMRAVEHFEQALLAAASLVAPGGRLALLIGEAQAERALSLLPPGSSTTIPLPSSHQRILLTWQSPS